MSKTLGRRAAADPVRLRQLSGLLDEALDLPPAEREAWLSNLGAEHQALAPRLRQLLADAQVETGAFMQRPAAARLGPWGDLFPVPDREGDRVGPYRLIEEIGVGGMATVWLAERDDGSLNRRVALKLPRTGWSDGLVQRMARERDLLAALEHQHIARLYDAGVTPTGRPWLAMEHVRGQPIDAWCRDHRPTVAGILSLVLQVCDALAHAHARLIVHRDLKPANILVTTEGAVRLVDFGVGKLLQDEPHAGQPLTQALGQALTPDYASPEQLAGGPLTVATDVYSLGVVLYELLAGGRPYRLQGQGAVALDRAILSADIQHASRRAVTAARSKELKGNLDAVLAKALARAPAQRYRTADALADDLKRHLHGQAVAARRVGTVELALRALRRHRQALALGLGAVAALGVGVGYGATALVASVATAGAAAASWQARQARRGRLVAERGAQRAQALQECVLEVFRVGAHAREGRRAHQITLHEALELMRSRFEARLEAQPAERITLWCALAEVYHSVELPDAVFELYERALQLARTDASLEVGRLLYVLDVRLIKAFHHQRFDRFEAWLRELEDAVAPHGVLHPARQATAIYMRTRWQLLMDDPACSPKVVATRMQQVEHLLAQHEPTAPIRAHAAAMAIYALMGDDRTAQALEMADRLVALGRLQPDRQEDLAHALSVRGHVRLRQAGGRPTRAGARVDLDEAARRYAQHSGLDHFLTLQNAVLQGHAWVLDGQTQAGLALARDAVAVISRKREGERKHAQVLEWLGRAELDAGECLSAAATLERALALWQQFQGPAPMRAAGAAVALARARAMAGDERGAREMIEWMHQAATPPQGLDERLRREERELLHALQALRAGAA